MYYRFLCAIFSTILSCTISYGQGHPKGYYEAPYSLTILQNKETKSKRFRDIKGNFYRVKVEFTNTDRIEHKVDYSCFYLVDEMGHEYNVHFDATLIKEVEMEEHSIFSERDEYGFIHERITKPLLAIQGWLLFEVPQQTYYEIKFRGYKKVSKP